MKRRIHVVATALVAVALAGAVITPLASGKGKASHKVHKTKPIVLRCKMSITTQPAPGSATVTQPAASGRQYGPITCHKKGFGGGIEATKFTVPDTGDAVGTYVQYLHAGSIKGSFDLTPREGTTSDTGFASQSWVGTMTVKSGTGVYKGIKGKKGTGVMKCASTDSVHLTCTEKIKVKLAAVL